MAGSFRWGRVIDVLSRLISFQGAPRYLRSDSVPEFVGTALLKWVTDEGIGCALVDHPKALAERYARKLQW